MDLPRNGDLYLLYSHSAFKQPGMTNYFLFYNVHISTSPNIDSCKDFKIDSMDLPRNGDRYLIIVNIYREYTKSLAYDMTQTRQKHAFSDHSDLVARRMGFTPFSLAVVLIKAIYSWILYIIFISLCICLGLKNMSDYLRCLRRQMSTTSKISK